MYKSCHECNAKMTPLFQDTKVYLDYLFHSSHKMRDWQKELHDPIKSTEWDAKIQRHSYYAKRGTHLVQFFACYLYVCNFASNQQPTLH